MPTIDFSKTLKNLYTAKRTPQEVNAGPGTFLAVSGQGAPGGDAFQQAIQCIYGVAYTVKFTLKGQGRAGEGRGLDFKVGSLECLYLSDPKTPTDQWQWQVMVRIPDEVTAKDIKAATKTIQEKKGLDCSAVRRLRWKEGRGVHVLHVGPYDEVGATYQELCEFAAAQGLTVTGPAHEIYLNDPRRTAPAKLKTIVRLGVKKR